MSNQPPITVSTVLEDLEFDRDFDDILVRLTGYKPDPADASYRSEEEDVGGSIWLDPTMARALFNWLAVYLHTLEGS